MPESKKPKPVQSQQLEPGTLLLDRYSIVHRVGGGGMGSVYQARDKIDRIPLLARHVGQHIVALRLLAQFDKVRARQPHVSQRRQVPAHGP